MPPRTPAVIAVLLAVAALFNVGAQDNGVSLRRGFREITLGASFTEVQDALIRDSAFNYRGEPDVSLRLSDGEFVIDSPGRVHIDRGLFQFSGGELYNMTLFLNRSRLDYFQLYEQLRGRYGEPRDLDPERALWEDARTRIELARPLTVRYLDLERFESERRSRRATAAAEDVTREAFLEEF